MNYLWDSLSSYGFGQLGLTYHYSYAHSKSYVNLTELKKEFNDSMIFTGFGSYEKENPLQIVIEPKYVNQGDVAKNITSCSYRVPRDTTTETDIITQLKRKELSYPTWAIVLNKKKGEGHDNSHRARAQNKDLIIDNNPIESNTRSQSGTHFFWETTQRSLSTDQISSRRDRYNSGFGEDGKFTENIKPRDGGDYSQGQRSWMRGHFVLMRNSYGYKSNANCQQDYTFKNKCRLQLQLNKLLGDSSFIIELSITLHAIIYCGLDIEIYFCLSERILGYRTAEFLDRSTYLKSKSPSITLVTDMWKAHQELSTEGRIPLNINQQDTGISGPKVLVYRFKTKSKDEILDTFKREFATHIYYDFYKTQITVGSEWQDALKDPKTDLDKAETAMKKLIKKAAKFDKIKYLIETALKLGVITQGNITGRINTFPDPKKQYYDRMVPAGAVVAPAGNKDANVLFEHPQLRNYETEFEQIYKFAHPAQLVQAKKSRTNPLNVNCLNTYITSSNPLSGGGFTIFKQNTYLSWKKGDYITNLTKIIELMSDLELLLRIGPFTAAMAIQVLKVNGNDKLIKLIMYSILMDPKKVESALILVFTTPTGKHKTHGEVPGESSIAMFFSICNKVGTQIYKKIYPSTPLDFNDTFYESFDKDYPPTPTTTPTFVEVINNLNAFTIALNAAANPAAAAAVDPTAAKVIADAATAAEPTALLSALFPDLEQPII